MILRFTNQQVIENIELVLKAITQKIEAMKANIS
jgi:very-short-patch-repair endonuclease